MPYKQKGRYKVLNPILAVIKLQINFGPFAIEVKKEHTNCTSPPDGDGWSQGDISTHDSRGTDAQ